MTNNQQLATLLAKDIFGMTPQEAHEKHICINCKNPPVFRTEAGRKEYELSALCEPCFDTMWSEGINGAIKINTDFMAESDGNLGVDASDAGLGPGVWPPEVTVRGIVYQRKNTDPYGNMMYIGTNNQLLVIFND